MWFGSQRAAARVGQELRLPPQWSSSTFCSASALPFDEVQHFRLPLRWCRECLSSWYHSPLFQDVRVAECPVHRTRLLDRCPHCQRFVDPLTMHPWDCSECRHALAAPPRDWRYDFTNSGPRVLHAERGVLSWRRADNGASLWIDAVGATSETSHYEMHVRIFEYMSALWQCFAGDHRKCAQAEDAASMAQYSAFQFRCPVAAAFLQAGLAIGVEAEPRGGWPSFRGGHLSGWYPSHSVPAWGHGLLAREQLRLFLLSALRHVSAASQSGWSEAFWQRQDASVPKTTMTSRGIIAADLASDDELLKASQHAAERCRTFLADSR